MLWFIEIMIGIFIERGGVQCEYANKEETERERERVEGIKLVQ